ncbi:oligosaccharyltransferase complex subunit delta (ribophorin II), partial [Paragonimus westermani]
RSSRFTLPTPVKFSRLNPGQRYTAPTAHGAVDLDLGHQMSLTLRLVDKHDRKVPLTAHQMFMQLTHLKTQQAITFLFTEIAALGVANAKAYQFRLEPEHSAADFDYLGGVYKMELIAGDTLFIKPIIWHMLCIHPPLIQADVNLHFTGEPGSDTARRLAEMNDVSRQRTPTVAAMKRSLGPSSLIGTGPTKAKPEIEHMFRAPERRAPSPIAWVFTIACAVPLLGLLVA